MKPNYLYLNRPQLMSFLVNSRKEYHVLGRGTGKTSGILARKALDNFKHLPRCSGMNLGASFQQILTRTIPSLIGGWEKQGFVRNKDYVIGRRPDKNWQWPEPFEPPVKYDYFISCKNGAGLHLGSQDVDGSTIGMNIQWLIGDEAKKLDKERLNEETRPAMRGYKDLFGHLSQYRSECFTTSMPIKQNELWILDERKKMDADLIKDIVLMQLKLIEEINKASPNERNIEILEVMLNDLRREAIFYQEASSLENYAILGKDYFDEAYRDLPDIVFETEILNIRLNSVDGCFYAALNPSQHFYPGSYNYTYLEGLDYDLEKIAAVNCKQDADCLPDERLRIAIDWGGHMNYMSVAQKVGYRYNFINELYVKHPEHIDHLAEKFARYYYPHRNKDLVMLYDVTGNTIRDNSHETASEQFIRKLKEFDSRWNIHKQQNLSAPSHPAKYQMCYQALKHVNKRLPQIFINEDKCEYLIISMLNAPLKTSESRGYEKDKSSERNPDKVDPLRATHASDTFDIHVNNEFNSLIHGENLYVGF